MNIISSDVQANEYKLSNIKSSDFMRAFIKVKILEIINFIKS